jgi:hypothetical protein
MKISHFTIIVLSVAAGLWWGAERSKAAQLLVQLENLQRQPGELARVRREHARLLGLQPSDLELARLHQEAATRGQPDLTADRPPKPAPATTIPALQPGIWAPATDWKNCGRKNPEAALETMLWASAGGDLAVLKETVVFDDASRAKIAALLASLPESARQQYATPEDLLALEVAGNVPLENAQFVARQQIGDDEVTEYVRLKSATGVTRQVQLTLLHSSDGWKLHVPAATVDEIAQSLPKALVP